MVRGYQKQVVRLKDPDSRYFEEVLFVLKDTDKGVGTRDIVAEANRILEESITERNGKGERSSSFLLPFLLGMLLSLLAMLPLLLR